MNWKYEAVDKLKGYAARKHAIDSIPLEIARLKDEYGRLRSARSDASPVSGGGSTREDMLLSNITHREELALRLSDAKKWVDVVDRALAVLDEEERLEVGGNVYYLYDAHNERSQDRLQGLTAAGALADEVALFPTSFIEQMIGRCSVEGARLWLNCNPESPARYVKTELIDKAKEATQWRRLNGNRC